MASKKYWLEPDNVVEHKVFGESIIVDQDTPNHWVAFQYKMYSGDGNDFEWSPVHVEYEQYFRKLNY